MTQTIRTTSTVDSNGNIHVPPLPQAIGRKVDISITFESDAAEQKVDRALAKQLLHGSVTKFDDPFGPAVSAEEWESAE